MKNTAAILNVSYDLLGAFKAMLKKKMKSYLIPLPPQIWILFDLLLLKQNALKKRSLHDKTQRQKRECKSFLYYIYVAPFGKNQIRSFHLLTVEQKQSNIMKFCRALFLGVFCVQSFKLRFFCLFY